jgi:hypothetical protein
MLLHNALRSDALLKRNAVLLCFDLSVTKHGIVLTLHVISSRHKSYKISPENSCVPETRVLTLILRGVQVGSNFWQSLYANLPNVLMVLIQFYIS